MVKSGLDPSHNSDPRVPRVSQYRQAMHLSTAYALMAIFLWNGLSLTFPAYSVLHSSSDNIVVDEFMENFGLFWMFLVYYNSYF